MKQWQAAWAKRASSRKPQAAFVPSDSPWERPCFNPGTWPCTCPFPHSRVPFAPTNFATPGEIVRRTSGSRTKLFSAPNYTQSWKEFYSNEKIRSSPVFLYVMRPVCVSFCSSGVFFLVQNQIAFVSCFYFFFRFKSCFLIDKLTSNSPLNTYSLSQWCRGFRLHGTWQLDMEYANSTISFCPHNDWLIDWLIQ